MSQIIRIIGYKKEEIGGEIVTEIREMEYLGLLHTRKTLNASFSYHFNQVLLNSDRIEIVKVKKDGNEW